MNLLIAALAVFGRPAFAALPRHDEAAPVPAVQGVVSALARYSIVAVAEAHGIRQAGDFYVALVRDTAFQRLSPEIVVEFASQQSQPLLDAYVLHGDSLPPDRVASIWRNTTKVASWESPTYARWLSAIRPPDSRVTEAVDAGSYDVAYRRELDRRSWIEWGDSTRARRFLELPPVPPSGTVTEHTVKSDGFGARHLWVYTPPGYPDSCARGTGCDLVVAFDGGVYVDAIPLPSILDSLTAAGVIRATVALLVDDGSSSTRLADLANHARFGSLVGNTLMPWLHAHYRATTSDPARTIITGSSAGGLAAAFLALERPDLFGNVLSQSGAFWRGSEGSNGPPFEWLTSRYGAEPKRAIRFFLDVGSTESRGAMNGTAPSIRDANRRLNAVLTAKGYTVDYFEVPGGIHAPESWRLRLPAGLARLAAGFAVSGALRPSR